LGRQREPFDVKAVRRQLYRAAMPFLHLQRFLLRPSVHGVRCVIEQGGEVLLVRHTYGDRRWAFPGGLVRRSEEEVETARREIQEELGVAVDRLRLLGRLEYGAPDRARHVTTAFACVLDSRSRLRPDTAEIAELGWFPLDRLPDDRLYGTAAIGRLAGRAPGP
jgi:ADP-ribose pyrophosphatase YjhB (NUDIX family)